VVAEGERIVYERSREVITLRGAASIEQDGAVVTGESIRYFMAEQVVRADATPEDEGARVQVFIPADVVEAASSDDAAGDDTQDPEAATTAAPEGEAPTDDDAAKAKRKGSGERGAPRSP
jgi:lipopolysaccharide export system protein LptA